MKKAEVASNFKVTWFPPPLALFTLQIHVGVRTPFVYMWGAQRPPVGEVQLEARCWS